MRHDILKTLHLWGTIQDSNADTGIRIVHFIQHAGSESNGTLPTYKDAYYLSSKSDGFNYLGDPFTVPGTKGISDAELLQTSTFAGFDFDKVWWMGDKGPELRNLPMF